MQMEELDKALAEVTTGLAELTRQVGPEAVEATFTALRIGAVVGIVSGAVLLLGCVGLLILAYKAFKNSRRCKREDKYGMGDFDWAALGIIASVAAAGVGIFGLAALFNPASWIALYDPAAAIAWRLLQSL
jgi:hypothetical protein